MTNNPIILRRAVFYIFATLFLIIILAIIVKASYPYIIGPRILSYEYEETGNIYTVRGTSTRVKILYIQGKEVALDQNGYFVTKIIKQIPYTTLLIVAKDRFDHSLLIKKEI